MKPKILGLHHDHIDGSKAVLGVLGDLYRLAHKEFPFASLDDWLRYFQNVHEDIVARFDTVTSVLQSQEALELLAYNYGRLRSEEGYVYVEGKFAPQYHIRGGLTIRVVVGAIYKGLRRAEGEFGIRIVPVICIGREADPLVGMAIARVACEYDGEMVLDLVCDEANHPPEKHLPAYRLTFGTKVRRDCHAGEWVSPEPRETYKKRLTQNIRTALFDLRCDGIGHAITLGENPDLVSYVVDHGIRVAGCPLSNLRSNLIHSLGELRVDYLLDRGVIYTLNADDDLFLPDMNTVIDECDAYYNFTENQCAALQENVFRGALGRVV